MRPRLGWSGAAAAAAAAVAAVVLLFSSPASAFQDVNCEMRPDNDEDNVIEDSKSVTLECTFDARVESCTWTHNEPMNENRGSTDSDYDFKCTGVQDQTTTTYCEDDNSVSTMFSEMSCGINIGNAKPEHTGRWEMNALGFSSSGNQAQVADHLFTLYTYNQSTVYLEDGEDNDVQNDEIETTYNYNDRNGDWEDDKTGWESLEFVALAYGGRPDPTFTWYIESRGNNLDELTEFRISEGIIGCEDELGYICNRQSSITFGVDDKLMEILDGFGVETNPEDEIVRFELACDIEQYGTSFVQTLRVDISVEKSYDNGALPASTIGIIVAVVVAVIILIVVVACLLWAKRSNRWCFAEDDDGRRRYSYKGYKKASKDPRDPRSGSGGHASRSAAPQSRSAAAGGGGGGGGYRTHSKDPYRSSSGERGSRHHHSSQQVHSTTVAGNSASSGAGLAAASAVPLTKRPPSSSSSSSSSSATTPDIKKQKWAGVPPKELRESLNKLNEERKYQKNPPSSSSASAASTPDTPRKKKRPVPLDLQENKRRQPLFVKNGATPASATPTSTSNSSNNRPTGATPKMHRGVWQAAPPYPHYQTTTSTTSSSSAPSAPRFPERKEDAGGEAAPPLLPKRRDLPAPSSSSVSNRESLNYADLDFGEPKPSRKSFMQDPRNQVLPAFTVVPRHSPGSDDGRGATKTTTVTEQTATTEYASVVSTSQIV